MMTTPYKRLELKNGYTLEIFDNSRKIAQDACVVILTAKMEIPVEPGVFEPGQVSSEQFEDIRKTLGSPIVYEYRLERNMIMDHQKEGVMEQLVTTFWENMGKYIEKPVFPAKLVLKEYKERSEKKKKRRPAC